MTVLDAVNIDQLSFIVNFVNTFPDFVDVFIDADNDRVYFLLDAKIPSKNIAQLLQIFFDNIIEQENLSDDYVTQLVDTKQFDGVALIDKTTKVAPIFCISKQVNYHTA